MLWFRRGCGHFGATVRETAIGLLSAKESRGAGIEVPVSDDYFRSMWHGAAE